MEEKVFNEIMISLEEAGEIAEGKKKPSRSFSYSAMDIKAIRKKLKLTQKNLAELMGISVRTLQNWEQGRRKPEGPAMAFLKVASSDPKVVLEALRA